MPNQLTSIKHVVQLMLENRSFDQMLGFLYADNGNRSPLGQPFDGLTGEGHHERLRKAFPKDF
jgi:phospholipase C